MRAILQRATWGEVSVDVKRLWMLTKALRPLPDKLMMPDGFAALRRPVPINAREIIRVHLLYSPGLRPEKRNNLTWPVLLSVYSSTASCTR